MPSHVISQDILEGFDLLGLPINEYSYDKDPEDVIFSYTGEFKTLSSIIENKDNMKTYSSVSEAMHAELGRNS